MEMYGGAEMAVRLDNECSNYFPVNVGVHQGLVLSPLLFMTMVNEKTKHLKTDLREFLYAVRYLKVNVGPMDEVTSVRLGNDTVEVVKEFCYLGDILYTGDVSSAVTGRIWLGWKKFKEVSRMLCAKHISLKLKGELYKTCVRSVLCYGAEYWPLKKEDVKRLQGTEKRIIKMICGKTLMDKYRSEELRKQVGVKDTTTFGGHFSHCYGS